jgi:hypothetical protein
VPLALLADQREEDAAAVEHAPQVQVQHPLPGTLRDVGEGRSGLDAGVVAQDVHGAEAFERRVGERLDLLGARDVGADAEDVRARRADRLDRGVERLGLDVGEDHLHALGRESLC